MKRLVLAIGVCAMLVQTVPAVADPARLAPADSSFGRYGLSVLGVRNAIRDLDRREDLHLADDGPALYGKLRIVEDSIDDWRAKYPGDTWVPRLGYALARTWMKLGYGDARERAGGVLAWIIAGYPRSAVAPWAAVFRNANAAPVTAVSDRNERIAPIPIEHSGP